MHCRQRGIPGTFSNIVNVSELREFPAKPRRSSPASCGVICVTGCPPLTDFEPFCLRDLNHCAVKRELGWYREDAFVPDECVFFARTAFYYLF